MERECLAGRVCNKGVIILEYCISLYFPLRMKGKELLSLVNWVKRRTKGPRQLSEPFSIL